MEQNLKLEEPALKEPVIKEKDDFLSKSYDATACLPLFLKNENDVIGLLAFALFQENLYHFCVDFLQSEGREVNQAEKKIYFMNALSQKRLEAWRQEATMKIEAQMKMKMETQPNIEAPSQKRHSLSGWRPNFNTSPPSSSVPSPNWHGFFVRLGVLLLAIIISALLLRYVREP